MKNLLVAVLALSASMCSSCAHERPVVRDVIGVMFYNAENLFDTIDNPLKDDDEFTPGGLRHWTDFRYREKLNKVSRTVVAVRPDDSPALVGLCEVENDTVLFDLTRRSLLKSVGYDYVVTSSPDMRGINVALLYKRCDFSLVCCESLPVDVSTAGGSATRDILHVTGRVVSGDTVDVYVCHWPSRIGGVKESEPKRRIAASVARASITDVFRKRLHPYVILMGDLNEGPDEPAVRDILGARNTSECGVLPDTSLVALMDCLKEGSYRYDGIWECYDQIIVSASMLNGSGGIGLVNLRVADFDFLLEEDKKYGGEKPFRTYNGYRWQNGYSDHLPVAAELCLGQEW